ASDPDPGALQRLVVLSHGHSRECAFIPDVKPESRGNLVWECVAGHSFSWRGCGPRSGREPGSELSGKDGDAAESMENSSANGRNGEDPGDASDDTAPGAQPDTGTAADGESAPEPGAAEEEEDEEDDLAFADDPRDENYRPSPHPEPQRGRSRKSGKGEGSGNVEKGSRETGAGPRDEDAAQIGPKRIRKAAKREILLCDFEGCGKIFSNRQYLNHHKKYQHVHQKTFTCSEPTCGKSFNFKKHLKEHEKLHSDKRDYICEFCARPFRTSSNLIIHRRIHTGEKPLQCEICGFTCRQKASLNWHMRKHDADVFYQFPCELCGKKFEKKDNVAAHKSKSHPEAAGIPTETPGMPPETPGIQLETPGILPEAPAPAPALALASQ
ncbi:PREDICTED: zinc finger protein 692, partial [Tinamus guttatus]|uniref:zinc finger protein 692 n=1 Tax=Tinamus guttatus TaxID=94827 RepID=UPI00052ED6EA